MRTTPINTISVMNLDIELNAVESMIRECLKVARGLPAPERMTATMRKVALETVNSLNQAKGIRERLMLHKYLLSDLSAN